MVVGFNKKITRRDHKTRKKLAKIARNRTLHLCKKDAGYIKQAIVREKKGIVRGRSSTPKEYYLLRFSYGKQSLEVSPFLRKGLFLCPEVDGKDFVIPDGLSSQPEFSDSLGNRLFLCPDVAGA